MSAKPEPAQSEWRVSFTMWAPDDGEPRRIDRIYHDEGEARDHLAGLLSMAAPHGLRPCGDHVWDPKLERRTGDVRRFAVFVCPGCGWFSDRGTAWCCNQPQCRVPDPHGYTPDATRAMPCKRLDVVATDDLPAALCEALALAEWETLK